MAWLGRAEAAMVNQARDEFMHHRSGFADLAEWSTEFRITGEVTITTEPEPVSVCASAKCDYCGRYGPLGSCEGCGSPNRPSTLIDVTVFGEAKRRYVEGL